MRLIDADEAKRAICQDQCELPDGCGGSCEMTDYIEDAPTIEAEFVRWINMDEDEPPLGQRVLVYRAQKPVEIMSMLYQDNEYWWRNDVDEIFKVYDNDYWMSIPEPPKEVGE